jgi:hypothetical protein
MLETKTFQPSISLQVHGISSDCLEISRLLAAAVISPKFCHLLLDDPEQALKNGFQGEDFFFTKEEYNLILSIRADSLADLANKLARTINEHLQIHINRPIPLPAVFGY